MAEIKSYEDLVVWQKAYALVLEVYKVTRQFPKDEKFALVIQMRRAAVSVPSNIAEGWGRSSRAEYIRFLEIARGSLYELQTQLRIGIDLEYLERDNSASPLSGDVDRLLNALIRSLRSGSR